MIQAPGVLDFSYHAKHHHEAIVHFAEHLHKAVADRRNVLIDFSDTQIITPVGATYLYSEIDKFGDTVTVKFKGVAGLIKDMLIGTGLSKLCGYTHTSAISQRQSWIPVTRGIKDEGLDKMTEFLIEEALLYQQLESDNKSEAERLVSKAIGEGMLNVAYHAYPDGEEEKRFWWVMAYIYASKLYIALCDRGVGIPKTLKEPGLFEPVMKRLSLGRDDGKMIKAAMEYTRSSRSESGGGLGSSDIQDLVLKNPKGRLVIVSGRGFYSLEGEGKENKKEKTLEIKNDIRGTLIQWEIPLAGSA